MSTVTKKRVYKCLQCNYTLALSENEGLANCPECHATDFTYSIHTASTDHHTMPDGTVLYTVLDLRTNKLMLKQDGTPMTKNITIYQTIKNILDHYRLIENGIEVVAIDREQLEAHNMAITNRRPAYYKLKKPKTII